ncbi:MAG: hypothetical protein JO086_10985 [Acidimicrobiia bacterium]|nr:hypothetical protein [Acidimicrobiia bacterium]
MARVALVVNRGATDLHNDGPPLLAAFGRLGIDVDVVGWGSGRDWARFDGVVVRNSWDYIFDRDGFLAWATEVTAVTRLANSLDVLRWNTDKRYLRDLQAAGIPTVPTVWVEPGDDPPAVPWDHFVVKPSVSAGARMSARYSRGDDIGAHVQAINAGGAAAMIQPYVVSVDDVGERGTYVFGGKVSHAIAKDAVLATVRAPLDDLSASSHQLVTGSAVDGRLADFAMRVGRSAPPLLYCRVDTVTGEDGAPVLMELEATEPFLFLEHAPPAAADLFARAVRDWLSS